jgi:mevalonate kinase
LATGSGYGKVILFNEHFVVHGIPAIASAIGSATTATVEPGDGPGITLQDDRPATPGYKDEKREDQEASMDYIYKAMAIDPSAHSLKVVLGGDLLAASGVGASAASCAAIARALSEHFGMGLDDERINEVAYQGERGYHGTPSGIDNTAATFGGLIYFRKGDENLVERLSLKTPVRIVMGNTGKVADTKAAVAGVKERRKAQPDKYEGLFEQAGQLVGEARKALETHDLEELGRLMDRNHGLLQAIEVSNDDLDRLVRLSRENGALGAKLTGGGLGGYMVALTPGEELQEKVAAAVEAAGFGALRTTIGV